MNKKTFIALAIVLIGACAFLFNFFYKEAKNTAITKLNEEQMIHAKQAAQGIEDFFATWTRSLNSLSKMDPIVDTDAVGKLYMKFFYEAHQEHLRTITRVDERGVILYNLPQLSSVGTDISDQKHMRELLRDHKPVISDVFRAIEGFDAVALYVPVFRGSKFKGGIAVLVNFESIANRYLDVIKIGETGYAWVLSRDGTQLYSPIPGFTGKSVFETIKDSPSLTVMVNDMLNGHEGAAIYTFDTTGDRNDGQIRKYAVYMPVHIANTFWSIAVASAEQDVLSGLVSFRNKLAFAIGAIFICGMVFSTLGAKAWLIFKEEEKRKQAEKKLKESEAKFRSYIESAPLAIFVADREGRLMDFNFAALNLLGYDAAILSNMHILDLHPEGDREKVLREFATLLETGHVETEIRVKKRDGQIIWVLLNVAMFSDRLSLGYCQDITEHKQAEEMLRQHEKELMMLTGRLISTQEEELRRLSRDLHDDLTQRLAVLAMDAGMIEQQLRPMKTPVAEETRDLKLKLIEVSEEVHDLSRQLHPSILEDLGLVQAVQSECATFTKRTGIVVSLVPGDVPPAIPNEIALCLYRVIQEGLRNIDKHAQTNEVSIALQGIDDGVGLLIQDFGIGFDLRNVQEKIGIGLAGMRERVRLVGGTMLLQSEAGKGTEIQISIPLGGKHGQTARTDCR